MKVTWEKINIFSSSITAKSFFLRSHILTLKSWDNKAFVTRRRKNFCPRNLLKVSKIHPIQKLPSAHSTLGSTVDVAKDRNFDVWIFETTWTDFAAQSRVPVNLERLLESVVQRSTPWLPFCFSAGHYRVGEFFYSTDRTIVWPVLTDYLSHYIFHQTIPGLTWQECWLKRPFHAQCQEFRPAI